MARRKSIALRPLLQQFLPRPVIERFARDTGFLKRRRKVDPIEFVWNLILGFGTGEAKSITELHRSYNRIASHSIVYSSFFDRFTPQLVDLLRRALDWAIARSCEQSSGGARLLWERVKEVLIADCSVIQLHPSLADQFPGTRTNHSPAVAKLYAVIDALRRSFTEVKLVEERTHDTKLLKRGAWMKGRLFLLDLGFYSYSLFAAIERHRGYFVSRLKDGTNPKVLQVHSRHRGRAMDLEGKSLSEFRGRLRRQQLDAEVEVSYRGRPYNGVRRTQRLRLRMVGVRNEETGEYHFYLTNLPAEEWLVEEVAQLYGLRWEIELLFRELKSCYQLDEINSSKRHIVEALFYASLLSLMVSRRIQEAVRERVGAERTIPTERWARIFRSTARELLVVVLDQPAHARHVARRIGSFLLEEAVDRNRGRLFLAQRCARRAA